MEFTEDEKRVLNVILEKYKSHICDMYQNHNLFLGDPKIDDKDMFLATVYEDFVKYDAGEHTLADMNIGILNAVQGVLHEFDPGDKTSAMATLRIKVDEIITLKITIGLN